MNFDLFRVLYIGESGSGKTTALLKDLKGLKRSEVDLYLVSPTAKYQPLYLENSRMFKGTWNSLNEDTLQELLAIARKHKKTPVVVFDDVGMSLKKASEESFGDLIINARHYGIVLLFLLQKVTQCPTILRSNADAFILFPTNKKYERDWLYKEFFGNQSKQDFNRITSAGWRKKHDFITVIKDSPKPLVLNHEGNELLD